MIDAGVITVDLLLAPESRPGDLRVRRASLLNERTLNLMDRLARSLGSCREVVPLVFSLCPCAHLVTLDAAERAAAGLAEDERRTVDGCLAERALMLEALLENIRVLALDASKLVCVPVQADSLAAYAKARAGFSGVIRTLQGFNLVTGQVDEDALLEAHRLIDRLTADCEGLLASLVFGISPEAFLEMTEPVQYAAWYGTNASTVASALAYRYHALPAAFGALDCPPVPQPHEHDFPDFADEMYHRLRNEADFEAEPVYRRRPSFTGALVREAGHPLIEALCATAGQSAGTLWRHAFLIRPPSGHSSHTGSSRICLPFPRFTMRLPDTCGAIACATTARGLLTHASGFRQSRSGLEHFHAVVSPTEWQFAPEGPGQQALESAVRHLKRSGSGVDEETLRNIIRLALFGLDACVPLDIRLRAAGRSANA
ncbi:MAG: hypothetical protein ACLT0O_10685 [Sutterella wadsworthensis]